MSSLIEINSLIFDIIEGKQLSLSQENSLKAFIPYPSYPFTPHKYPFLYQEKVDLLPLIYPCLNKVFTEIKIKQSDLLSNLWFFLLPLALELASLYQEKNSPIIMGIL